MQGAEVLELKVPLGNLTLERDLPSLERSRWETVVVREGWEKVGTVQPPAPVLSGGGMGAAERLGVDLRALREKGENGRHLEEKLGQSLSLNGL